MSEEKNPIKILYLDMDECAFHNGKRFFGPSAYVKALNEFCKESGYRIVFSSVWRGDMDNAYNAADVLKCLSIEPRHLFWPKKEVAKANTSGVDYWRTSGKGGGFRGTQVRDHIEAWGVDEYLLLDDSSDFYPEQLDFLVKVNGHDCFTPSNLYQLEKLAGLNDYGRGDRTEDRLYRLIAEQDFNNKDYSVGDEVFCGHFQFVITQPVKKGEKLVSGVNCERSRP